MHATSRVPPLSELPLEVLSNTASLLAPPFRATPPPAPPPPAPEASQERDDRSGAANPTAGPVPGYGRIPTLDPRPAPDRTTSHEISLVAKTCHTLLEAARPWLWENVDVRSGRGWLAVVNALTEEVLDEAEEDDPPVGAASESTVQRGSMNGVHAAVSPQQAHAQPMVINPPGPRLFSASYSPAAPPQYPSPYASSSAATHPMPSLYAAINSGSVFSSSPPQPERASLLVTPQHSGGPSPAPHPHPILKPAAVPAPPAAPPFASGSTATPASAGPVEAARSIDGLPSSSARSASASRIVIAQRSPSAGPHGGAAAKLRGRSRSPRRSIGFATDGIEAVLSRGRSVSAQRQPGARDSSAGSAGSDGSANTAGSGSGVGLGPGPSHWTRRPSFDRRRSSLSRSRTRDDISDDVEEDSEDGLPHHPGGGRQAGGSGIGGGASDLGGAETPMEIDGEGGGIGSREGRVGVDKILRILTPPKKADLDLPPAEEEQWWNVNPELLPAPGPYIRHLSFVNFRTIGSRRTQDEAVRGRFVTAGRLEGVIKNAPNLVTLCMTEYVDSSLSYEVIDELFFRGSKRPRLPRRLSSRGATSLSRIRSISVDSNSTPLHDQLEPHRPVYVPYEDETEDQKWRRRGMFTPLEALDLTGCISGAFQEGIKEFWERYFAPDEGVSEEDERDRERGRGRRRGRGGMSETETEDERMDKDKEKDRSHSRKRTPIFPHLKRLSLRACFGIDSHILDSLLHSFTSLTHLDLSGTKVSSRFLANLTDKSPRTLRLQSLSLARCPRLDPYVVVEFLCRSPAAFELVDLNLFVNPTQGNPIRPDDLLRLITNAPCFKSGQLRYLDLSSAMFSPSHLAAFPPQPSLVSLGLSHIPHLPLPPIADFLLHQAPNVEILTLTGTAAESSLRPSNSALQINLELHARLINPLTTVPFSLSSLSLSGAPSLAPGPSRLRVIELSSPVRRAIGPEGGSHEWKIIKSKGGRGWYVDVSAGWVPGGFGASNGGGGGGGDGGGLGSGSDRREEEGYTFVRHMKVTEGWRRWLMSLSEAGGRVGSAVGWHSRKMEVVRGWGMVGREEGLAGAGAFAFEE